MTPEIRTMGQAVVFNFRMGQKLTQIFKIPSGALSIYREVVPPEHRSKEARSNQRKLKNNFVSLHAMSSAQRNQKRG